MVSVKALQLQRYIYNLICLYFMPVIPAGLQTVRWSCMKKHFCSSQPGKFMTTWLLSSSPRIYRTLAFLSGLLSSVWQRNNSFRWKTARTVRGAILRQLRSDCGLDQKTRGSETLVYSDFWFERSSVLKRFKFFLSGDHHLRDLYRFCGNAF